MNFPIEDVLQILDVRYFLATQVNHIRVNIQKPDIVVRPTF